VSVSVRFAGGRGRSRVSVVVAVVVFAVLAAVSLRFVSVAAAAEPVREEVGNFIFEISADNILGVTNKTAGVRFEDNLDAVSEGATLAELETLLTKVADQFKADFGWDLTVAADRARVREEIHSLSQALFSIPDATLEDAEYASVRALRDVVAGAEGTAECRDRCLPDNENLVNFIISTAFGASVAKMLAEFTVPGLGAKIAICSVGVFIAAMTWVVLEMAAIIHGVQQPHLRGMVIASVIMLLSLIGDLRADAGAVAVAMEETVPQAIKEAAKEIESLTPTEAPNESSNDYDLIKDEL